MKQALLVAILSCANLSQGQTLTMVKDISTGSGSSEIRQAILLKNRLYFSAMTAGAGRELWSTNGSTTTRLEQDLWPGTGSGDPRDLVIAGDRIGFFGHDGDTSEDALLKLKDPIGADPGVEPLHRPIYAPGSTGTVGNAGNAGGALSGLGLVAAPSGSVGGGAYGGSGTTPVYKTSILSLASPLNDTLFTSEEREVGTGFEPYMYKLSRPSGDPLRQSWTGSKLRDINATGGSSPGEFTALDGKIFFTADDGVKGRELWVTNGTSEGTLLVKDIRPGSASSSMSKFTKMGNKLYFIADDGTKGRELWCTNGTTAGTILVKDINTAGSSGINDLKVWKDKLYFGAQSGALGKELWCSDGTANGTLLVKDINPTGDSGPKNFSGYRIFGLFNTVMIDKAYLAFAANDGVNGEELWRTDGTAAGTVLLKDLNTGTAGSSPTEMYVLNTSNTPNVISAPQYYYYSAIGGTNGRELWEFNALANTHKKVSPAIAPTVSPLASSQNWPWIAMGNALYFYANYDSNGGELWKVSRP